jgi:hypothetical protein
MAAPAGQADRTATRTAQDPDPALFDASHGSYRYRRLHQALLRGGEPVGPELVRALMRELGLVACQPRPWRTTTLRDDEHSNASDLVGRDFTADAPGSKLSDITYIRTWAGWLHLATVIDCFNREVIGYAMADHMRTSLVADAVEMATRNYVLAADCIFHSDRGTQYTLTQFGAKLTSLGMRQSLGRKPRRCQAMEDRQAKSAEPRISVEITIDGPVINSTITGVDRRSMRTQSPMLGRVLSEYLILPTVRELARRARRSANTTGRSLREFDFRRHGLEYLWMSLLQDQYWMARPSSFTIYGSKELWEAQHGKHIAEYGGFPEPILHDQWLVLRNAQISPFVNRSPGQFYRGGWEFNRGHSDSDQGQFLISTEMWTWEDYAVRTMGLAMSGYRRSTGTICYKPVRLQARTIRRGSWAETPTVGTMQAVPQSLRSVFRFSLVSRCTTGSSGSSLHMVPSLWTN